MEITLSQDELNYVCSLEETGFDFSVIILQLLTLTPVSLFVYEQKEPETEQEPKQELEGAA